MCLLCKESLPTKLPPSTAVLHQFHTAYWRNDWSVKLQYRKSELHSLRKIEFFKQNGSRFTFWHIIRYQECLFFLFFFLFSCVTLPSQNKSRHHYFSLPLIHEYLQCHTLLTMSTFLLSDLPQLQFPGRLDVNIDCDDVERTPWRHTWARASYVEIATPPGRP